MSIDCEVILTFPVLLSLSTWVENFLIPILGYEFICLENHFSKALDLLLIGTVSLEATGHKDGDCQLEVQPAADGGEKQGAGRVQGALQHQVGPQLHHSNCLWGTQGALH